MEKNKKSQKFKTKRKTSKMAENGIFVTQNKQICVFRIFKVKFIIINLRLVKLLLNFNKNIIVYLSM